MDSIDRLLKEKQINDELLKSEISYKEEETEVHTTAVNEFRS